MIQSLPTGPSGQLYTKVKSLGSTWWASARLESGASDGGSLSQFTDNSGNNNHATVTSGDLIYRENVLNGLPAYDLFTSSSLATPSVLPITNISSVTVFLLTSFSSPPIGADMCMFLSSQTGNARFYACYYNAGSAWFGYGSTAQAVSIFGYDTDPHLIVLDGSASVWEGGNFQGSVAPIDVAASIESNNMIGYSNSFLWTGYIYEAIIFPRVLGDSDRQEIGNLLSNIWQLGITQS